MVSQAMFIVNPESRGGETGKTWDKKLQTIKKRFFIPFDHVIAQGRGTGISTTLEAIADGYDLLIPVGGEGTVNEVVNGIYHSGKAESLTLGFIRSGTVNDYLKVIGWPHALEEQLDAIMSGKTRKTPITHVEAFGEATRVGLNVADIGIGTSISYDASVKRSLTWIKSGLRYTLLALKAITKWKNIPCTIKTDEETIEGNLTLFMAGFSKESGAYKVLPHAEVWGEKLAYMAAMGFSKPSMLRLMGVLKKGEHEGYKNVHLGHSEKIELDSDVPLMVEMDGEVFAYQTQKVTVTALPNYLNVISPS